MAGGISAFQSCILLVLACQQLNQARLGPQYHWLLYNGAFTGNSSSIEYRKFERRTEEIYAQAMGMDAQVIGTQ